MAIKAAEFDYFLKVFLRLSKLIFAASWSTKPRAACSRRPTTAQCRRYDLVGVATLHLPLAVTFGAVCAAERAFSFAKQMGWMAPAHGI
jgi:hypothetical protein